MKLETLALVFATIGGLLWLAFIMFGALATPIGIPMALVALGGLFLLVMVLRDRTNNAEDDYYEKNVDK